MRRLLPLLVVLLASVTACQGGDQNPPPTDSSAADGAANETATELAIPEELVAPRAGPDRDSGPQINPEIAPGVAFNYRYAFRLDADRVAEAQQAHQRLCERYGVARCRITAMTYRAASEDDVEALLALAVDPAIAGQLGRESVQAVLDADGTLAGSDISGTEVASGIDAATRRLAELNAELERIEARLREARPRDKGQLEYQAESLRQQIRDLRGQRESRQASLATTPMLLRYGSGDLAPGPAPSMTLEEALAETGDDFLGSLTFLLVVLVRLAPWGVAAGLAWLLVRWLRRRYAPRPAVDPAETVLGI